MHVLALDTCLGACSAAVLNGDGIVARRFEVLGRGHAERLVPMVQEVMAEARLGFSGLDRIGVTVGPGTFTGVRIGLAAARGFALAAKVPLVGVTSTETVAEAVYRDPARAALPDALAVIHDARRGEVYVQIFRKTGNKANPAEAMTAPAVVGLEEVSAVLPAGPMALAGTGAELVKADIKRNRSDVIFVEGHEYPDAADVGIIAIRKQANGGMVQPLYLRAPDARLPAAS